MSKRVTTWLLLAAVGVGSLFAFSGCGTAEDPWKGVKGGPTRVLVSFPPLYCFAKNVAGPDAAVLSLLTTNGPHDYEPTNFDSLKVGRANLFLVNGLGLDEFVTRAVNTSGNPGIKIVKVGEAVPDDQRLTMGEHHHDHHHHDGGDHHDHGFYDPHIWLGVPQAILMVQRIGDVLGQVDPAHKTGYDSRTEKYIRTLNEQVLVYGRNKLADKKNRKIIATHDSLGYFAKAFGLEVVDNLQPRPGVEADAAKLAALVERCTRENIRVLTVEPQYSRATADTLGRQLRARNLDIAIVEVDTLETADEPIPDDLYVDRMRQNIDKLAEHLR